MNSFPIDFTGRTGDFGKIVGQMALAQMRTNLALGKGVTSGLVMTPGIGLNVSVTAGTFHAQVPAVVSSPFTVEVPPSYDAFLWIEATTTGPPNSQFLPYGNDPGATWVNLGHFLSDTTSVTIVPLSAQPFGQALVAPLVSAELAASSVAPQSVGFQDIDVTAGDVTPEEADASSYLLLVIGTPGTGRNLILPATKGLTWAVVNCSDAVLVVKTAAGTGPTIATNKSALIACDGTNIWRLTADA